MNRLAVLSLLLATVALISGCSRSGSDPAEVVTDFYQGYRGDYRQADAPLLSDALSREVAAAKAHEKKSAAQMKASATPTDKPDILEGDVFCGLYEGYTGFEIAGVRTEPDKSIVSVGFTNSAYHTNWVDEVVLVNQGGWKVDDVLYGVRQTPGFGLREVLRNFTNPPAVGPQ